MFIAHERLYVNATWNSRVGRGLAPLRNPILGLFSVLRLHYRSTVFSLGASNLGNNAGKYYGLHREFPRFLQSGILQRVWLSSFDLMGETLFISLGNNSLCVH